MDYVNRESTRLSTGTSDADGPLIYVIDAPEHPFPAADAAAGLAAHVAIVPIHDWNDALTPYPAPALYRNSSAFGGHAFATLGELDALMPQFEAAHSLTPHQRAICGYSLGGSSRCRRSFVMTRLSLAPASRGRCGTRAGSSICARRICTLPDDTRS